jgi:hypothetical protein
MKKVLVILTLIGCVGASLYAQEGFFSVGGGAFFGSDFGGGFKSSGMLYGQPDDVTVTTPYIGGGAFLFFDATIAELSTGILFGGGKSTQTKKSPSVYSSEMDSSYTNLYIGVLVKYPFAINDRISLFPLLGVDYQITLSAEDIDKKNDGSGSGGMDWGTESKGFSALWFRGGGGADFAITDTLFLRGEILYGIRLANKNENDVNDWNDSIGLDSEILLGHGLTVKFALGYKF